MPPEDVHLCVHGQMDDTLGARTFIGAATRLTIRCARPKLNLNFLIGPPSPLGRILPTS